MARVSKSHRINTLHKEYKSAVAARSRTGNAYRRHKTPANFEAYKKAERRWQIVGEELGKLKGIHRPRHAKTGIFRKASRRAAGSAWAAAYAGKKRRRKSSRSRKSR